MRCLAAIAALAVSVATSAPARAEPPAVPAAPLAPRVLNVPTADLQGAGRTFMSTGISHRGIPFAGLSLGLGDVAEVDVEVADRAGACELCSAEDRHATSVLAVTALFKVGLAEGRFTSWQPALALGLRAPIGERDVTVDALSRRVRTAKLYLGFSKRVGPVRVHGGGEVWDASAVVGDDVDLLHDRPLRQRLRPYAGLAWNPSIYPRTTLLADFSSAPVFDRGAIELRWLGGWGVRYQAVSWASVELAMRHRGGDSLSDSTVMVRVNASFPSPL